MKKIIMFFTMSSLVLLLAACNDKEESKEGTEFQEMTSGEYNEEVQKLFNQFLFEQEAMNEPPPDLTPNEDDDVENTDSTSEEEFMDSTAESFLLLRNLYDSYSGIVISGNEDSEKLAELFQDAVVEIDEYYSKLKDISYEEFTTSDEIGIISDDLSMEIVQTVFIMSENGVISDDTVMALTFILAV